MLDVDQEEEQEEQDTPREPDSFSQSTTQQDPRPARENRKDKDLNTFLNSMDKYAPIVLTQWTFINLDSRCCNRLLPFPGWIRMQ